jgi:hypothetical protein
MGDTRNDIINIHIRYIYNVIEMGTLILHNFPIGKKETLICSKQIKVSFYYKSLRELQEN